MPSAIHEGLVRLFQVNPGLAATLLRDVLGIELPPHREVRADSSSFSDLKPPEYRADVLTVFDGEHGKPALACIVEVQLDAKEKKRRDWLAYTASAVRQLRCDACVLVVTPDAKVAEWAATPMPFGFVSSYLPLVIGPKQIPLIADPEQAKAAPFLAVLSAVAHGQDDPELAVQAAAAARDAVVPLDDGVVYFDLIKASLSEAARKAFEMLPATYEFQDPALRASYIKGEARSKADDVLTFLDARGLTISDEQRERVLACADLDVLKLWVRKAATVASVDELFD